RWNLGWSAGPSADGEPAAPTRRYADSRSLAAAKQDRIAGLVIWQIMQAPDCRGDRQRHLRARTQPRMRRNGRFHRKIISIAQFKGALHRHNVVLRTIRVRSCDAHL